MAQKSCKKDCKGLIVDKDKGIYCRHLEAKLPTMARASKVSRNYNIENFPETNKARSSESKILLKLIKHGLDPHEVELIMLRYVENKTVKEIVKEQGWLSLNSCNYHLRKALNKLRDGKFNL